MNEIVCILPHLAKVADRNIRVHLPFPLSNPFIRNEWNIRVHLPFPLSNPFIRNERTTVEDVEVAYEAYLRNRLISGDKLITAEMERIASFVTDGTKKPVGLIGTESDVNVIRKILMEALSQ